MGTVLNTKHTSFVTANPWLCSHSIRVYHPSPWWIFVTLWFVLEIESRHLFRDVELSSNFLCKLHQRIGFIICIEENWISRKHFEELTPRCEILTGIPIWVARHKLWITPSSFVLWKIITILTIHIIRVINMKKNQWYWHNTAEKQRRLCQYVCQLTSIKITMLVYYISRILPVLW